MRYAMLGLLVLCPLTSHAWEAATEITPADAWEDLGTPVKKSRVYSQAVGKDTAGNEVYYLGMTDAVRAFVVALDPMSGESTQFNLEGYPGMPWGLCAHSNGKAYASTGSGAAWVVLDISPAKRIASLGLSANANGIGANRMSDPLPPERASVSPAKGFPSRSNLRSAAATVFPMSKHRPVLLRYPSRYQRR